MMDGHESRQRVCFCCGERRLLVPERYEGQGWHRVCDECHAVNGPCGRCGYRRESLTERERARRIAEAADRIAVAEGFRVAA
jgi:hypothetical protein